MTSYVASAAKWTADGLRRPFDTWGLADNYLIIKIPKAIIMVIGKIFSLLFQAVEDALSGHDFTLVEDGEGEMVEVAEKISVATWNALAFPPLIAESENRPGVKERLPKINEALNNLENIAYLGLQEAHTPYFQKKIVESQSGKFTRFQINNKPKLLGFGSGLESGDCLPEETKHEVHKLDDRRGGDGWVNKSFTVARVPGKMTIINTHLQSGESNDKDKGGLTNAEVRQSQVEQIVKWARESGEKVNILLGDLNVPRNRFCEGDETTPLIDRFYEEYENSWLNPNSKDENGIPYVIDGFATDDDRRRFTQADLNKDGSIASKEAVDNILAIVGNDGQAHCRIETKQLTPFEDRNDPSDHALLVADIIFT